MQNRTNTTPFIHAQQYSDFILTNLHDGLLPDTFSRDVSDFGSGTILNIKTLGSASVQDVTEGTQITPEAISSGTITLAITNYIGDAWYVSDELKQDGSQIDQLMAMRGVEATRAIQEAFETKFLSACNTGLTAGSANVINGQSHRKIASGPGNALALADIISMKLAFDKAGVPAAGRIAIVDPVVEASLNTLVAQTNAVNYNPSFNGIINEGFAQEHKFVVNIFGFDVYTTNRNTTITTETIDGTIITNGVANVFMSILDDNTRPVMRAWRVMPSVEGWREQSLRQDHYQTTARFGFGVQRTDTLGIILTSAVNY